MTLQQKMASQDAQRWLHDNTHLAWLRSEATRLFDFFRPSLRVDGRYDVLALDGSALPDGPQELHTTTRMIHSFALGKMCGEANCDDMIDAGMKFLWDHHRDQTHGGYLWSVGPNHTSGDANKLAYGHVFVLLAASSAKKVGHPDADRLLGDICEVLDTHFWDDTAGRFREEYERDWHPFSTYRGMNANMHGVEALLTAYEATNDQVFLTRAGRILGFFVSQMAPEHGWRIPEHYTATWDIDPGYSGNPMFRPAGTTPGHSVELGRLALQYWDLAGRPKDSPLPQDARHLIEQALRDAWTKQGGIAYTLDLSGQIAITDRYWWPITEAIGAYAALLKLENKQEDEDWYRKLWTFAANTLIDPKHGGWFPELDAAGTPTDRQFAGKPDIYHALQATLFPGDPRLSQIGQ